MSLIHFFIFKRTACPAASELTIAEPLALGLEPLGAVSLSYSC